MRSSAERVVAVVVAALLLSACNWLQAGYGADRAANNAAETGLTADNVDELAVAWTASVGGPAEEAIVADGTAYVRGPGALTALSVADGAERWRNTSLPGSATPVVDGGLIQVPTDSAGNKQPCLLQGLDTAGSVQVSKWFGDPLPPAAEPLVDDYWCGAGDALAANDLVSATSFTRWRAFVDEDSPVCPLFDRWYQEEAWIVHTIDPADGSIAPLWDSRIVQSDCSVDPPASTGPVGRAESNVAVGDGTLVSSIGSYLLGFPHAGCGAEVCFDTWRAAVLYGDEPIALGNGHYAVALRDPNVDSTVSVVDGTSHEVAWTTTVLGTDGFWIAASASTLFVAGDDGTLAAFPVDGCGSPMCAPSWTATLVSPASARPTIGGDVLYVGGADGSLAAFSAGGCGSATCTPRWTRPGAGSAVTGAPVVVSGTVFFGTADGTVTALRRPG